MTETTGEPIYLAMRVREAFDQFENIYLRADNPEGWLLKQRIERLRNEVLRRVEEVSAP